jgi:DNA primase
MAIADEDVARVRSATDFVALASEHVALRRVGRRWVGLCPFHAEKSPSFTVNAEEGLYYCFGCQAKGDVITFVREVEHLDFVEAVEKLAARAGISVRYDETPASREHQHKARLHDALERAAAWYHQRLVDGPDGAPARRYLRHERGYDGQLVRSFQLGWAPQAWDGLVRALALPDRVLRDAGLAFPNRSGRLIDAFRGRIMFPIFDAAGKAVGFGGRILPGGEGPKYKNTAETVVYAKSRVLYGLNWAKKAVVDSGEVVVCEGYTDVIGMHTAGVPQAVATCGTALADGHVRLLTNFARRIVLAYDADTAGQAAADRFYNWERKFDVDIVVATLPTNQDPADLARRQPDALREAVRAARPYLAFRLERALARADLRSPEGRARAAAAAMAVVAEHPNGLVRDQYLMQVADRCRIDPNRLRAGEWGQHRADPDPRSPTGRAGGPRPPAVGAGSGGGGASSSGRPAAVAKSASGPELEALRLAVHRPEVVADRLEEQLFADELHRASFRALASAPTLRAAIDSADPDAADLLQRLAVEDTEEDPDDVMIRLLERAGARALVQLQREARGAPAPEEYAAVIGWLKLALEELRSTYSGRDAEARLVPWLVGRREEADE